MSPENRYLALAIAGVLAMIVLLFSVNISPARDLDGRYAQSPLKPWFDSLKSELGPCCSDADGYKVDDPDWESKDGHYRVRIDGEWVDVPDKAIINEPNRAGPTMVWKHYYDGHPHVRCFIAGAMI